MRVTRSHVAAAMILSFVFFGCKAGQALRVVAAGAVVAARVVQLAAISQANRAPNAELETADAGPPSAGPSGKRCTEIPPEEGRAPIIVCGGTVLVVDEDGRLRPLEGTRAP